MHFCNEVSHLQLGRDHAEKLYATICDQTEDFAGAHNLVGWDDFKVKMREHVRQSPPNVAGPGGTVAVGGLWFDPLYQTIVKSMPDVPDRDKVSYICANEIK